MNIKRKIIRFFILTLAIVIFTIPAYGFTLDASAEIGYFGKGSVVVNIDSNESKDNVKTKIEKMLSGYNLVSSRDKMVQLESLRKVDGGYQAEVSFQRIDKVGGLGKLDWGTCGELLEKGSMLSEQLKRWEKGNLRMSTSIYKYGLPITVMVTKDANDSENFKITPTLSNGETIKVETIAAKEDYQEDKILSFAFYDLPNVSSIVIRFPGKVVLASSLNVERQDDYTIKLTPTVIKGELEGVDGETDITSFIGYVVYEPGTNPIVLPVIIAIIILLIVFFVLMYIHYGYKKGGIERLRLEMEKETDEKADNEIVFNGEEDIDAQ